MNAYYHSGYKFACVDPGLRGCGVAEFIGGGLYRAAYIPNPAREGTGYLVYGSMALAVHQWCSCDVKGIIIEHPRIYPQSSQQKGDPNDIVSVAAVGAAIAAVRDWHGVESVYPANWKGQVPKDVMTERIRRSLAVEESVVIEPCAASLKHNVLDAIGMGLHKLNRINKRVIANG